MAKAILLYEYRQVLADGTVIQMRLWEVPEPVAGPARRFKYSLFYGRPGERIVLFDNERDKGDHVHIRDEEHPYLFRGPGLLIGDFKAAVRSVAGVRL